MIDNIYMREMETLRTLSVLHENRLKPYALLDTYTLRTSARFTHLTVLYRHPSARTSL